MSSCLQSGHEEMILSHLSTHLRWNMCVHGSCRTSSFSLYCARQMQHSCSFLHFHQETSLLEHNNEQGRKGKDSKKLRIGEVHALLCLLSFGR